MAHKKHPADIVALLRETWPLAFAIPPQPLALGIGEEIAAALGGTSPELRSALGWWTRRLTYRQALTRGGARIGLDGAPNGHVSAEHQADAIAVLRGGRR